MTHRNANWVPLLWLMTIGAICLATAADSDPANDVFHDMLTPAYYQSEPGEAFRDEVDRFIHFARQIPVQHPLADPGGRLPGFAISEMGSFGAPKGPRQDAQHHPAIDLYLLGRGTVVDLYAAHSGTVTTARDVDKYRHVLAITQEVIDDKGKLLGRVVTLYGHIDLDLDEADGLFMDGQTVEAGDRVSGHLYAETVGGPHLHLEIRYYRPDDRGTETFYGGRTGPGGNASLTEPAAGAWSYGYWDPEVGYGFADPRNHGIE